MKNNKGIICYQKNKNIFSKLLPIIFICTILPFLAQSQTPTPIIVMGVSNATYIYVGSLTRNTTDADNCQKLKIDIFGGGWFSNTNGQTTFYIGNRGGLSINEVTIGGSSINASVSLHAYQNGNQTDFYLIAPANGFYAFSVTSYWITTLGSASQFVMVTSSATAPSETEIIPLTITPVMTTDASGNIGIGTTNPGAFKLAIKGNIHAQQVNVDMNSWSDYVFKKDYTLPTLTDVKTFIDQNHHLPEIPSEQQIAKDGLNLGEMNKLLLKKVEELTLYLIEKDQKEKEMLERLKELENKVQKLSNNK